MAVRAQVISEDSASGGTRINGSTRFCGGLNAYAQRTVLKRNFLNGNSKKWTISFWYNSSFPDTNTFFGTDPTGVGEFNIQSYINMMKVTDATGTLGLDFDAKVYDRNWYHCVYVFDTAQSTNTDRVKFYLNGTQITDINTQFNTEVWPAQDYLTDWNRAGGHEIGSRGDSDSTWFDGRMSEVYHIDNQALEASDFGYTDTLTGIWRPKKFTGSYGTSYNTTDATGGNTILSTDASGSIIESGYRTDSSAGTTANQGLVLAWPGNIVDGDVHDHINTGSSAKTVTAENNAAISSDESMFYGQAGYVNGSSDSFRVTDHADLALGSGDYTVEFWFYPTSLFSNFIMYDGRHPTSGWPTSSGGFALISNATGQVSTYTAGSYTAQTENARLAPKRWNHVAVVRNSGTQKIYINGREEASASNSTNHTEQKCNIGNAANDGEGSKGYYNDFRIYKGTAKYTSEFYPPHRGTALNSFYLPLDGSAPIGEDQSGQGNHWTAAGHGYGGSVHMDRASGALPIYNTVNGGSCATPSVRGRVGVAVTVYNSKYYLDGEEAKTVNFVPGQTVTFDTSDTTVGGHPFRLSPKSGGSHGTTDYSVDFDGNDYLTLASSSDFEFTGDHTIEMWIYHTDLSGSSVPYATGSSGSADQIYISPTGEIYYAYGQTGTILSPANAIVLNKWQHLAVTKSGTTLRAFVDGQVVAVGLNNTSTIGSSSATASIGYRVADGYHYVYGKISDFRIVKGTAVYTEPFTPPTTPLTNITNTKLLCCNSSSVTGSTVEPGTITSNGDPSASTDTPYDTYSLGTVTGASEGSAGAATTITIPNNAPSSLYYYCTNHSGMGGSIGVGDTNMQIADPYAWKNVLALPLLGTVDDVSQKVNCTTSIKSTTASGTYPTTNGAPFGNFYNSSYYFDESNDYVSVTDNSDFDFGSGDFTVEGWIYLDNQSSSNPVIFGAVGGWYIQLKTSDTIIEFYTGSTSVSTTTSRSLILKQWHHIAVTRKAGALKIFVNGIERTSVTNTDTCNLAADLYVGSYGGSSLFFGGYMQEWRVYKGICKYESQFNPASTVPYILPDSPSGIVYDSARKEQDGTGYGAIYMDGSGDYLSSSSTSSDYAFGTGDFTVEAWVNFTVAETQAIFENATSNTAGRYMFGMYFSGDYGKLAVDTLGSTPVAASDENMVTHRWYHCVSCRESGTHRLFLDGKQVGSATDNTNYDEENARIGWQQSGGNDSHGYISNVRVVKGTAVYTAEFDPPKEPLTSVTNTVLLCCQSKNSVTQAATSANALSRNGHCGPTDFNPFKYVGVGIKPMQYAPLCGSEYDFSKGMARTVEGGQYGYTLNTSSAVIMGTGVPMKTGKWYCEIEVVSKGCTHAHIGICKWDGMDGRWQPNESQQDPGWGISHISGDGSYRRVCWGASWGTGQSGIEDWGETWAVGDYLGIMLNCDDKIISFFKNGHNMGTVENGFQRDIDWGGLMDGKTGIDSSDIGSGMVFVAGQGQQSCQTEFRWNMGEKPWKYPPRMDDGRGGASFEHLGEYQAQTWNKAYSGNSSKFLKPKAQIFTPVIWDGTGASHYIDVGFKPDLVVHRKRSGGSAVGFGFYDSVRGATKVFSCVTSEQASDESTVAEGLKSFDTNGFTLGTDDSVNGSGSSQKYLAYCWKAGGNKGTWNLNGEDVGSAANAGLTAGDTSVLTGCSINTDAGFSIVTWTQDSGGAAKSIAHGLSQAPTFVWMKQRNVGSNSNIFVHHKSHSATTVLQYLNAAGQEDTSSDFGNAFPTSSVITTNTTGVSGREVVMYAWHDIPGVMKTGYFTGWDADTGQSNGPKVHLGFKPAFIIIKARDHYYSWFWRDTTRNPHNPVNTGIWSNDTGAESTQTNYDIEYLSDGFKVYNSSADAKQDQYIYAAWAENPTFSLYSGANTGR